LANLQKWREAFRDKEDYKSSGATIVANGMHDSEDDTIDACMTACKCQKPCLCMTGRGWAQVTAVAGNPPLTKQKIAQINMYKVRQLCHRVK
jgi:hypothetical protein